MNFKKTYFLCLLIVLGACSTKKNTRLSRGYHNLTAHYNVYFNGVESFKEGVKAIEDGVEDDYTQILSVFPESKKGTESTASSQMDRAIEKGTKLIKVHSIRKKPEKRRDDKSVRYQKFLSQNEFNKWVDNAYLLIGKSHFYKKDYYIAQQSFAYMYREFQKGPEWYEAEIWDARTAIELGDFAKAKIILENYDLEGNAPAKLFGRYAAAYADYHIRQEQYKEAIPYLHEAIDGAWSRFYKRRFNFILAQLYEKQKEYTKASEAYEAVIKSNPPYKMAFNAKVNRAGIMFEEGGLEAVKKEIKKLLRDKRNSDYEDQIYYALAKAYKAEDQEELAMENFLLSIEKNTDNMHQRGLSYYEMYDIFYVKPEYKPAFYYLDTAVINLNEYFPDLDEIKERHESLSDLVDNINIVEREDSLMKIMAMPEKERLAFIDNQIKKEKERQEALKKAQEEAADAGSDFFDPSLSQSSAVQNQGGKWYFYNQTSVGMGKLEFEKKWGRRKLEDNWRRVNKQVVVEEPEDLGDPDDEFGDPEDGLGEDGLPNDSIDGNKALLDAIEKEKESDPLKRESYLKDLPSNPELWIAAQKRIQEGLLNQGLIYKDELQNIPYAIDAFDEYTKRFTKESLYLEDVLMNLYLCYEIQEDNVNMARIKNELMKRYPDGEFTAYLNDPDYFEKRKAREKKIEELYQQAYANYLFNDFNSPISNLGQVIKIDEENELIPKFKFLAGLAYAKQGKFVQFEKELNEVKDNYPDNEVTPIAIKILELYADGRMPVKGPVSSNLIDLRQNEFVKEQKELGYENVADNIPTAYTVDHKNLHGLILIVNQEADVNRLKFNIADYNFSKFLLNDYEMSSAKLPDGSPIFMVSGFKNRLEALDYFYSIRERKDIFEVDNLKSKGLYVIHGKNLEYLLSSGDKEGYDMFFNKHYLSAEAFKNLEIERRQAERDAIEAEKLKKLEKQKELEEKQKQIELESKENIKEEVGVVEEETRGTEEAEVKPTQTKQAVKEDTAKVVQNINNIQKDSQKEEVVEQEIVKEGAIIEKPSTEFIVDESMLNTIVLFKKGRINTERTATVFKNYTKSNYGSKYTVESDKIAEGYFFIKTSGFSNKEDAKKYIEKIKLNSFLMREISRTTNYLWIISNNNFHRLSSEESFKLYHEFYKSNY